MVKLFVASLCWVIITQNTYQKTSGPSVLLVLNKNPRIATIGGHWGRRFYFQCIIVKLAAPCPLGRALNLRDRWPRLSDRFSLPPDRRPVFRPLRRGSRALAQVSRSPDRGPATEIKRQGPRRIGSKVVVFFPDSAVFSPRPRACGTRARAMFRANIYQLFDMSFTIV